MILIRLAFLSELPYLNNLISDIKKNTIVANQTAQPIVKNTPSEPTREPVSIKNTPQKETDAETETFVIKTLEDISNLAKKHKERLLAFNIESYIRPISIEQGKLICSFTKDAPRGFSAELAKFLTLKTKTQWEISIKQDSSSQTLKENKAEKEGLILDELKKFEPLKSLLTVFPKATIGRVKEPIDAQQEDSDLNDQI